LTTLTQAISAAGGPEYSFVDIAPVDDKDGGAPGGNIRVAYLYKPSLVRLFNANPGGSLDATTVLDGPSLSFNPGRIDPANPAWSASRKPLVAQWEVIGKKGKVSGNFFTINVHFGSKGGSSSIMGDARPPVNGGVDDRLEQATLTASFVKVRSRIPQEIQGLSQVRSLWGGCRLFEAVQIDRGSTQRHFSHEGIALSRMQLQPGQLF
jgi:predicted extracellular nuclease